MAAAIVVTGGARLGMTMARANCRAVYGQHRRQHRAVAQMHMPVVGTAQVVMVSAMRNAPLDSYHISIDQAAAGGLCRRVARGEIRGEVANMTGCIVGWAHSKFGKHEGQGHRIS